MSDLDDLEELATISGDWTPRTQRFRHKGDLATHCKRGHALTPDNLWCSQGNTGIVRRCKKCKRLRNMTRGRS